MINILRPYNSTPPSKTGITVLSISRKKKVPSFIKRRMLRHLRVLPKHPCGNLVLAALHFINPAFTATPAAVAVDQWVV